MHAATPTVAAARRHSVGCRRDGTVVAAGADSAGECRVERWDGVIAVAAGNVHTARNTGRSHTVGLRSDGTVLATGWNRDGQCDVTGWRDVTAVAAGWRSTLGLLSNGTVLAAGRSTEGQGDVRSWREIVAVSCGDWHSVAVRADVVAVAAGSYHTLGLTASGRVLAAGDDSHGQCQVGDWRNIVAVAAGSTHSIGLCADGTVRSAGNDADGQCAVDSWAGIRVAPRTGTGRETHPVPAGGGRAPVPFADMDPARRFDDLVDTFVARDGVTPPGPGRGFGRSALRVHGRIFAMLVRGSLVLKLPEDRVSDLVRRGAGEPFDANKGAPMREWLRVDPASGLDWAALAQEALAHVARDR